MQALAESADVQIELRAWALDEAVHLGYVFATNLPLERLSDESLRLYQELEDPVGIARALFRQGGIARVRSRFTQAQTRFEEAAARFRELGERWWQCACYTEWARVATIQGQYERARALLSESLLPYQALGDANRVGWVFYLQAHLFFLWQQDQALAERLVEQSLAHFREVGSIAYTSLSLGLLGLIHMEHGEQGAARPLLEECQAIGKQAGWEMQTIEMAFGLARLLALQGDGDAARRQYQESLALLFACHAHKEQIAAGLEGLAALEAEQGEPLRAGRLWGAAEALREAIGAPMHPVYHASYEQSITLAHRLVNAQVFRTAWEEGRRVTPEQVLAPQPPAKAASPAPVTPPSSAAASATKSITAAIGLTARELEVLRLVAQGLTDAQVADQLVISPRTVNGHLRSIYSKLGVTSRAAATRYTLDHHLA
jgi:ATP/maltotriose-dependent transcriptional regulator MalT